MKQFRFTEDQKAFLNECFGSSLRGGERIRDKKALQMMKVDSRFNGKVDPRSGRSLVLKQSQIRASFSRQAATLKRAAIDNALDESSDSEQESSAESDDGAEAAQAASGCQWPVGAGAGVGVGAVAVAVAVLLLVHAPPTAISRA